MKKNEDERPDWVKDATEEERKEAQAHSDAEEYE